MLHRQMAPRPYCGCQAAKRGQYILSRLQFRQSMDGPCSVAYYYRFFFCLYLRYLQMLSISFPVWS